MWFTKFRSYWDTIQNPIETSVVVTRNCASPGCPERGDYRAPKSPHSLNDYYWFCLPHVTEYNRNWDFFKGMSQAQIEAQMKKSLVGDRPTWRSTKAGFQEDRIKRKVYERFTDGGSIFDDFIAGEDGDEKAHVHIETALPHPAVEALAVMGLSPPIDWEKVKKRYKQLAKKYHPDTNRADANAEEQLKKINLAYSILKVSYQNYNVLAGK